MGIFDQYTSFIFDFDGVLVDSLDVKGRAFAQLFSDHGQDVMEKIVAHHLANGGMPRAGKIRHYFQKITGRPIEAGTLETMCETFSSIVVEQVVAAPQIPGATRFLQAASEKGHCYVNSATPDAELADIIRKRQWQSYFKTVLGSDHTKSENLEQLIDMHGLERRSCVFFGDARKDYEAALECGMDFVGLLTNPASSLQDDKSQFKHYRHFEHLLSDEGIKET